MTERIGSVRTLSRSRSLGTWNTSGSRKATTIVERPLDDAVADLRDVRAEARARGLQGRLCGRPSSSMMAARSAGIRREWPQKLC